MFEEELVQYTTAEYVHIRATFSWYHALILLIGGDFGAAYEAAESGVAPDPHGINAPSAAQVQARAAVWLRDPDRAARALSVVVGFRGRRMQLVRETTEAGLAAISGRSDDAMRRYERVFQGWRDLDAPLDLAFSYLDAARLLEEERFGGDAASTAELLISDLAAAPLLKLIPIRTGRNEALAQRD
jgi:hypothetical protein